jgi:hypothetical protein
MKKPILIEGMHGMGDNVHQRAVVRQIMQTREVWLETSWPAIYHDLVGPDLKLIRRAVNLRTQTKNAQREADKFQSLVPPPGIERIRVMYHGQHVMQTESKTVLEAMCRNVGVSYPDANYTLPVPYDWIQRVEKIMNGFGYTPEVAATKPLCVYRPLVSRNEWRGSAARNANEMAYAHLFAYLRNHFFVVSVADLVPGVEWIVGPQLKADATLHHGELSFEELAALFREADLIFTSSGFSAILAPAVETPCINIVGGYEDSRAHDSGAKFAPLLSIDPVTPCRCWTSACRQDCTKEIDMIPAVDKIAAFVRENLRIDVLPMKGIASDMYHRAVPGPDRSPPLARPFGGQHPLYRYGPQASGGLKA